MPQDPIPNRMRSKPSYGSADDPYCEFKDDRERRNALMSRDLRVLGCRLVTVVGLVRLLFTPWPAALLGLLREPSGAFNLGNGQPADGRGSGTTWKIAPPVLAI